ncbi:hypothetical protein IE53DRAFT_389787 [Violaceomyces palustris]|uniref:Uncharacterized protein n=1 Tax=Violaceomyces palustris TaxID=1673888 RepID=A0ACD0NQH1_9BASI|nr:hypothetical protein IE53DRAFT_389787 [Violaceomyces palustris]
MPPRKLLPQFLAFMFGPPKIGTEKLDEVNKGETVAEDSKRRFQLRSLPVVRGGSLEEIESHWIFYVTCRDRGKERWERGI